MRNTDKHFWLYAGLYILLGCSIVVIANSVVEVVFLKKPFDLVSGAGAAGGLVLSSILLASLKRKVAAKDEQGKSASHT